jgi:hypothetical protein
MPELRCRLVYIADEFHWIVIALLELQLNCGCITCIAMWVFALQQNCKIAVKFHILTDVKTADLILKKALETTTEVFNFGQQKHCTFPQNN